MALVARSTACAAALVTCLAALRLGAQPTLPSAPAGQPAAGPAIPIVAVAGGTVVRGTANGEQPVSNRWVVLHRIRRTADSVGGAAIDSMRTDARGRFRIRYRAVAGDSATFFVSTSHHGLAYVSNPLRADGTDEDASLTVYDTTSRAIAITVAARHLIVFAPDSTGTHRVAEIYALSNDTTVTRVAGTSGSPVWSTTVPAGARNLLSGLESAAPDSLRLDGQRVSAFSPFAPGVKRVAFAYFLPRASIPLSIPIDAPTPALEVLAEGPASVATGAGLVEVSPMSIEGRNFRRFQAQNVAAPGLIIVDLATGGPPRTPPALAIALGIAAVMTAGVLVADRLRRRGSVAARPVPAPVAPLPALDPEADALARQIAELDREFARHPAPSDAMRARHDETRQHLKAQLAGRLAGRDGH